MITPFIQGRQIIMSRFLHFNALKIVFRCNLLVGKHDCLTCNSEWKPQKISILVNENKFWILSQHQESESANVCTH